MTMYPENFPWKIAVIKYMKQNNSLCVSQISKIARLHIRNALWKRNSMMYIQSGLQYYVICKLPIILTLSVTVAIVSDCYDWYAQLMKNFTQTEMWCIELTVLLDSLYAFKEFYWFWFIVYIEWFVGWFWDNKFILVYKLSKSVSLPTCDTKQSYLQEDK